MMGGGAFILLKAGRYWPESAKQAETRLAILLKILQIARSGGRTVLAMLESTCGGCVCADFRWVWLICRNSLFCYPDHSFSAEIAAVSCKGMQGKDNASIGFRIYTLNYIRTISFHLEYISCLRDRPKILGWVRVWQSKNTAAFPVERACTSRRWFRNPIPDGMAGLDCQKLYK
jgi:hypothetical protein